MSRRPVDALRGCGCAAAAEVVRACVGWALVVRALPERTYAARAACTVKASAEWTTTSALVSTLSLDSKWQWQC